MNAIELLDRLSQLRPELTDEQLLRLGLLVYWKLPAEGLADSQLLEIVGQTGNCLRAIMDQHSAIGEELDALAAEAPTEYSPQHLWTLAKALKVKSQVVDLYLESHQPRTV